MNVKNIFLYLVLVLLINTDLNSATPNNWTSYYSDNEVKIEYQYTDCQFLESFNQEFVIFKITNLTNKQVNVSWNNESWYDKKCINCNDDKDGESFNEVSINPNQIVIGDCYTQNSLRIFSKFSDKLENMPGVNKIVKLTKFKLQNINIKYE